MIYVTCRYAPMELMAGFDEEVGRLDPNPAQFYCAEMTAHANLCSYVKALLEEIHHEQIKRVIITDCCDSSRRLYDVLVNREDMEFVYLLPLPHKTGPNEIKRFASSLKDLKEKYEDFSNKKFDYTKFIEAFNKQVKPQSLEKPFLALQGAHCCKELKNKIADVFAKDVALVDFTCAGNRYIEGSFNEEDFFEAYAKALLQQQPTCLRMYQQHEKQVDENCVGIIYHTIKFCDYYSFGYMKHKKGDLPMLKLETDTTPNSSGQLKTRLQAFKEELGFKSEHIEVFEKEGPIYTAGIDIGSSSTDVIVMNASKKVVGKVILPTVGGTKEVAKKALEEALSQAWLKVEDLSAIVTTGYGRDYTDLHGTAITEITCHAKGAHYLDPSVRTVIDIGGQDSKVICLDEFGNVINFAMNDKCAAGTGRFLEMQSRALGLDLDKMSHKGLEWTNEVEVSSMCSVFAESEVVSLVARNVPVADIIHGLNEAIANKTYSLMNQLQHQPVYMMTGGVAKNEGVVVALEKKLKTTISVSPSSQLCGAIGAALLGLEAVLKHADH